MEYGQKLRQKCDIFTNFQRFLEEKDQIIHLNDKFPLKITNISLQKQNFPGMRFPNSTFCPCIRNCGNVMFDGLFCCCVSLHNLSCYLFGRGRCKQAVKQESG